jgi:hypothetical protein
MPDEAVNPYHAIAEREMLIRSVMGRSNGQDREFLDFVLQLDPTTNEGIEKVAHECELLFEPKYKQIISELWAKQSNLHIQEICDNLHDAWFEYIFSPEAKGTSGEVRKRIAKLLTSHHVEYADPILEHIVSDIFICTEHSLSQKLFAEHLRQHSIPEAAILLLYPSLSLGALQEYAVERIQRGGFYPEPVREAQKEDQASTVVRVLFPRL